MRGLPTQRARRQESSAGGGRRTVSIGPGRTAAAAAAGAAAGAAVTYFLDPSRGRRRRAQLRDKAVHVGHEVSDEGQAAVRDARNRAKGVGARARRRFRSDTPTAPQLVERVRAEIGRWCSHPGAVSVEARDGTVTLAGPILRDEVDQVRAAAALVPGVESIEDRLAVYESAGDIPALQGNGQHHPRPRPEYVQKVWSPSARAAALAGGSTATAWGLRHRGVTGWTAALGGVAVTARAWTNRRLAPLVGARSRRGAVSVTKTITIDTPVDEVYALWSLPSSFPLFMRNVLEVREGKDGRTHWKVRGPAGTTFAWEARITQREPDRVLAWKTTPGSVIQHTGRVAFEPTRQNGTRVTVQLAYDPLAGFAGHGVAKLLGQDPKRQLDEDLLRMKDYLETGRRPHGAAVPASATPAPEV